jgi:Domain of unknown function (DUF222)
MCEAVEQRAEVDYALLTHAQRVDELARLQRARAALDAAEARLLHAMHADPLPNADGTPALDKMWVREDVACVLRVAPQTATAQLHSATELVMRLPATLAMLETGQLTALHARRLVEASFGLPDALVAKIEARVLRRAAQQSVGQFGAGVRRAVLALDPRGADERHEDALADRRVVLTPQPDGIIDLHALGLPAPAALAIADRIQAHAARLHERDAATGLERSADQRRADALIDLITDAGTEPAPAAARPAVNVTVALSTLLGVDDQPGELDGYGPIPAAVARALAFDPTGTWRRLLTDQAGRLVDVTSHTYRPPAAMARLVRLRDRTCCYPGCARRSIACELDHRIPWPDGATCPANLHPLCGRHHRVKHDAGWTPVRDPDGTTRWTAPSGHTYARPPDDLPCDATIAPVGEDQDDPPPY